MDKSIVTIFKWYKYPDSIPSVFEDDTFSDPLIVVTSTGEIMDDIRYRSWGEKFISCAMGYDHHRFEVDNVSMFGYLKSLNPVKP